MLGSALRRLMATLALLWLARRQPGTDAHQLGRRSETLAAFFLRRQGYRIVARNVRCGHDELDLVAVRGWELVFVEVKSSRSLQRDLSHAVDEPKAARLRRAAKAFMRTHALSDPRIQMRFDLITVRWPTVSAEPAKICHYRDIV